MEPAVIVLISVCLSAVITGIVQYFTAKKASKTFETKELELTGVVQDMIKSAGQAIIETINTSLMEQLDPILKVNSQAMSIIGKAGAAANQMKMMERQVMEAVNEQLPISPDMIAEFSPALAETLRKYPELMPKALQVFEKVTGSGGDWGFNVPRSGRSTHPMREE
jgi:hypothetical protein